MKALLPDAKVFVLNSLFHEAVPLYRDAGLVPVLGDPADVRVWATHCPGVPCALHIDTGMNRLGLRSDDAEALATDTVVRDRLNIELVMSHYACADDTGHPKTTAQLEQFKQSAALFHDVPRSIANSAGTLHGPEHHFEMVRPGIAIYGGEAINDVPNASKPVAQLEARILQVREAKRGETVGYGASQTLVRDSRIAIVAVGYADGYHRAASGAGVSMRAVRRGAFGAIDGMRVPALGRLSMDLSAFDITDASEDISAGDWIELFGKTISVDDAARACGTIGYELLTGLWNRYERTYLLNGETTV